MCLGLRVQKTEPVLSSGLNFVHLELLKGKGLLTVCNNKVFSGSRLRKLAVLPVPLSPMIKVAILTCLSFYLMYDCILIHRIVFVKCFLYFFILFYI